MFQLGSKKGAFRPSDSVAAFYRKYGFIEFPKIPTRLFLPMATIEKMFFQGLHRS